MLADVPLDTAAAALGTRLAPLLRAALAGSVADCADEAAAGSDDCCVGGGATAKDSGAMAAAGAAGAAALAEVLEMGAGWEEAAHALLRDTSRLRSLVARHLAAARRSPGGATEGAAEGAGVGAGCEAGGGGEALVPALVDSTANGHGTAGGLE
jgi:hypothetical protein